MRRGTGDHRRDRPARGRNREAGALLEDRSPGDKPGLEPAELALGLLAACLSLIPGPFGARPVVEWLELTLGSRFERQPFPARTATEPEPAGQFGSLRRAGHRGSRACPTWFDRSPLTFELAEEILLREGRVASDPERDSGAFRFLFEHGLIHQLELYRRMLLWMAWFWTCSGQADLAESAGILAWQLADEQFAVPSHPFAAGLMARSLDEAQRAAGNRDRPQSRPRKGELIGRSVATTR